MTSSADCLYSSIWGADTGEYVSYFPGCRDIKTMEGHSGNTILTEAIEQWLKDRIRKETRQLFKETKKKAKQLNKIARCTLGWRRPL